MNKKNWPLVLVLVDFGAFLGFTGWMLSAFPEGLMWSYVAGGVALFSILSVCVLWRHRARMPLAQETPEDRPRLELPPGTREERRADLFALWDGRLSIEEFVDRWSGREILEEETNDVRQMNDQVIQSIRNQIETQPSPEELEQIKKKIEEAVLAELKAAPPCDKVACDHCLGLHGSGEKCPIAPSSPGGVSEYVSERDLSGDLPRTGVEYVSGVTPYAEAEALMKSTQWRAGQWVRVKPGGKHHEMLVFLVESKVVAGLLLWTFSSEDGAGYLADQCFELAYPKKDEFWEDVYCPKHSPLSKDYPPRLFKADEDWPPGCMGEPYLRCGCIRPVNYGYRPGFAVGDKVRVVGGYLTDRIGTVDGGPVTHDTVAQWVVDIGGQRHLLDERLLQFARPKKGEVWHHKTPCATCDPKFGDVVPQSPFNVHEDWEDSWITHERVRYGCLYRIGMQG